MTRASTSAWPGAPTERAPTRGGEKEEVEEKEGDREAHLTPQVSSHVRPPSLVGAGERYQQSMGR